VSFCFSSSNTTKFPDLFSITRVLGGYLLNLFSFADSFEALIKVTANEDSEAKTAIIPSMVVNVADIDKFEF